MTVGSAIVDIKTLSVVSRPAAAAADAGGDVTMTTAPEVTSRDDVTTTGDGATQESMETS